MRGKLLNKICRLNARLGLYTPRIREYAFLIGAMKSGTTTLYEYLVQHPQIVGNRIQKEPEYFSRREPPIDVAPYQRQYFPLPFGKCIALDGSTGYSKMPVFPNVAKRLNALPGNKQFIYIVRNPIDRIESHVAHRIAFQSLKLSEKERPKFGRYISVSRYGAQLKAYERTFPDSPVKVVMFEDLKRDPIGTVQEVARHLGIHQIFHWRPLPPQNARPSKNHADKFRLFENERLQLQRVLHADMRYLADNYEVDISRWGFP